ncbi:STE24 endopeptidase [Candidatus Regiella insecticola]|uniref:STE24 endopeptidase n=1 Tax=Candidatus Regiella insecticola TaxID=138073 RepID=A0A6L2ZM40_9ENTR|nr:STE24 endopeptidase [Candidatus Regiella insecticola]
MSILCFLPPYFESIYILLALLQKDAFLSICFPVSVLTSRKAEDHADGFSPTGDGLELVKKREDCVTLLTPVEAFPSSNCRDPPLVGDVFDTFSVMCGMVCSLINFYFIIFFI